MVSKRSKVAILKRKVLKHERLTKKYNKEISTLKKDIRSI